MALLGCPLIPIYVTQLFPATYVILNTGTYVCSNILLSQNYMHMYIRAYILQECRVIM